MNTEQLGRLLTALEAIAANTQRIADAADTYLARLQVLDFREPATDLNPEGTHA